MKLLVRCVITREIPVEVDDKFKVLIGDPDDDEAVDQLYERLIQATEQVKRKGEYIEDICRVTDAESKKILFEF